MPDSKRPEPKRRSPASRPGRAGDSVARPRRVSPAAAAAAGRRSATPDDARARRRTDQAAIAESVEQRSDQRLGFTARRAAILAAVICVLTLTIAGPVRTYFAQRTEMKQLAATEAALRHQIADLEQQKGKLGDPAYIAAQARERLGFVNAGRHPVSRSSCRRRRRCPPTPGAQTRQPRPAAIPGTRRCGTPSPTARTARRCRRRPHRAGPVLPGPCRRSPRRPVVDRADLEAVARQLGREPRGVLEIAYRCPNGEPGVVKTAPKLPDGTPFPTLYYLTHPALTAAASRLETTGTDARDDRAAAVRPRVGRCLPAGARVVSGRAGCHRAAWAPRSPAAACRTGSSACTC